MKRYLKKFFEASSMNAAISPVVTMIRQSSMIPFNYHIAPGKSKASLNLVHFLKILIPGTFYWCSFILVVFLDRYKLDDKNTDKTYIYGEKFQIYSGCMTLHCILAFTFVKVDNLAKNFEYSNEIDKLFEKLGSKTNFTKKKMIFVFFFIFQQVISMIYIIFVTYLSPLLKSFTDLPLIIVKNSGTYYTTSIQMICSFFTYVSIINLRILNEELMKVSLIRDATLAIAGKSTARDIWRKCDVLSRNHIVMEKLDLAWKAYAKICDCIIMLSDYFSMTMFAIIAGSFLNTVFQVFHLMSLVIAAAGGSRNSWEMFSLVFVQSAMNYWNMYTVILTCNTAEKEANETSRLINNMMGEETDEEIADKLHLISTHMLHTYPKFSAAGLFPINNTLHFTIVGALTTYMVILYQFSVTLSSKKNENYEK